MYLYERRTRGYKRIGPKLDIISIILGIGIIISGIILVIDVKKYIICFPILFTMAALMNLTLAFKHYKMAEMGRALILAISFIVLTILSIVGYIVTLS